MRRASGVDAEQCREPTANFGQDAWRHLSHRTESAVQSIERADLIHQDSPTRRQAFREQHLGRPGPCIARDRANDCGVAAAMKLMIREHDGGPDAALLAAARRSQIHPHEISRPEQG